MLILITLFIFFIGMAISSAIVSKQKSKLLSIINQNYGEKVDWVCAIVLFCSILTIMYIVLGFAKSGIDAPFAYYGGDEISWYATIKGVLENGWYWHNDYLGAPFGTSYFDWEGIFLINLDFLLAKILGFFTDNYVIVVNLQFLMAFALCGLSSFFVLRALDLKRIISLVGGVLFAFSPYIFYRNTVHPMLASCYLVPFSILLCVWLTDEEARYRHSNRAFWKNRKNIATIGLSLLIANNGIGYYPVFTCFLLCVVALFQFKHTKKRLPCLKPMIVVGCIFVFFMLNLLPSIVYQAVHGTNTITYRNFAESEIYGLKITQLFLPTNAHGMESIQRIIEEYNQNAPLINNENLGVYLGVGGIVGFVLLMLCHFAGNLSNQATIYKRLRLFSNLVIASVLLGTIGGFSSLLSLIGFRYLRSYCRISIYIEFICICALCCFLQAFLDHQFNRNNAIIKGFGCALFSLFFAYCLFDLLPAYGTYDAQLEANKSKYVSDSRFVNNIEEQLQEGDMVFQLPYHQYPEAGSANNMRDYHLFTGYLHSTKLKWSYGGIKGREGDLWLSKISSLPIAEMINALVPYGFRGIYIDTRAYTVDELTQLTESIEAVLNETPLCSENNTLLFYNLYPYISDHPMLTSKLESDVNKLLYSIELGKEIYFDGTPSDAHRYFLGGISFTEEDFAWTDGYEALFRAFISEREIDNLVLQINLKGVFHSPQEIVVNSGSTILFQNLIETEGAIIITIPGECIKDGWLELNFQFPNALSPMEIGESGDTRKLAFALMSFSIK